MNRGRILVVDDEKNMGFIVQTMLERAGFEVALFQESYPAKEAIESEDFHAIVTDLYMPILTGMDLLEAAKIHAPGVPVVMVTAFGTVETAVQALKRGAFDYITKPFDETELLRSVEKAVAFQKAHAKEARSSLVAESDAMREIHRLIQKVAPTDSTVLILGESGTGKELVAEEIRRLSKRAAGPLIRMNCATVPSALIESELFGYEKGAFTGAMSAKPGRFELAHEGTLFLDEVSEMSLEMQAKVLRAIQEKSFERVGSVVTQKVDVRFISATNRNLEEEVKLGRFREDLFYRLDVFPIQLPPLRERTEDVPLLVETFLREIGARLGKKIASVDPLVLRAFQLFRWPGNIRQLENSLERMALMCEDDRLKIEDLPSELVRDLPAAWKEEAGGATQLDFKEQVRRRTRAVEKNLIEKALEENERNVTRTAEKLGLSRKGLQLKLKELGIKRPADEPDRS